MTELEKLEAERKRAEKALQLAYTEIEQIFKTAYDAMCVIDKCFNIVRTNQTYASMSSLSSDIIDLGGMWCCDSGNEAKCD